MRGDASELPWGFLEAPSQEEQSVRADNVEPLRGASRRQEPALCLQEASGTLHWPASAACESLSA